MTVIILFCLVPFLFTAILPAQATMDQQTVKLLKRKAQDFPIWSTRFLAMMKSKGFFKSLLGTEERPNAPAQLANGASNDETKNHLVLEDAYEKEVADIKEKWNNVWCHLGLTLDATTVMLMRHDFVGDDGIGDGAKDLKLLQEKFQSVETPTVLNLVAQLAQLQLEDAEIWIASSSEDRSCSQDYKKQGKQSQRPSSTPWSSIVCR